jgi:hypothetical protein
VARITPVALWVDFRLACRPVTAKRLASPAQRIVLHAKECSGCALLDRIPGQQVRILPGAQSKYLVRDHFWGAPRGTGYPMAIRFPQVADSAGRSQAAPRRRPHRRR